MTGLATTPKTRHIEFRPLGTARDIQEAMPTFERQFGYSKWIEALLLLSETKEARIELIETCAAMAKSINDGMQDGSVKLDSNTKHYEIPRFKTSINPGTVHLWRTIAKISNQQRQKYYEVTNKPTRKGLVTWATNGAHKPFKPSADRNKMALRLSKAIDESPTNCSQCPVGIIARQIIEREKLIAKYADRASKQQEIF